MRVKQRQRRAGRVDHTADGRGDECAMLFTAWRWCNSKLVDSLKVHNKRQRVLPSEPIQPSRLGTA
eukprot:1976658-Rhodomonas_salina.2